MKTNKLLACIFVLLLGAPSCLASTSDQKTETRNLSGFHGVQVSTGIDLYLKQGSSESVTVVADEDIIGDLITEVEDGTLRIHMKNKFFDWSLFEKQHQSRKVYVTFKNLDEIGASSGSDVQSEGELKIEKLSVDASSGSDVNLTVDVNILKVETSSGSDAKLKGLAKSLELSSSSGSDLDASELKAQSCSAHASSGSDIKVYVTEKLEANASSGSDIIYSGDPAEKDIDESSGGDVHHK